MLCGSICYACNQGQYHCTVSGTGKWDVIAPRLSLHPPPSPPSLLLPPPLAASLAAASPWPVPPHATNPSVSKVQAYRCWPHLSRLRVSLVDPAAPLPDPPSLPNHHPLMLSLLSPGQELQVAVFVGSESTSLASSASISAGFVLKAPVHHRTGLKVTAPCRWLHQIRAAHCRYHLQFPLYCWPPDPDLSPLDPVNTCSSGEGGSSHCPCASHPIDGATTGVIIWLSWTHR
jgi:hypothetical protein